MLDTPVAPLDPAVSPDAAGDVRAPGLLLFETSVPDLHVEPDALADALAELEEATARLDALYANGNDGSDDLGLFGGDTQQRGPDGRWTSGGASSDTRVASAGSKDGLGRSKAAGEARTLSAAAKTASAATSGGGGHADAAKAHVDAAAQHREAATRSARADYKAAHEMAAAAHEKAAEAHAEHASREARQADDRARGDRGNLHETAATAAQAHQQAAAAQRVAGNEAAAKAHDQGAVRHVEGRRADEAHAVAQSGDRAASEKGAPLTAQERSGIASKHDHSARAHEAAAKAFSATGSTGRADRYAQGAKDARARADYYKAGGDPHTEKAAADKAAVAQSREHEMASLGGAEAAQRALAVTSSSTRRDAPNAAKASAAAVEASKKAHDPASHLAAAHAHLRAGIAHDWASRGSDSGSTTRDRASGDAHQQAREIHRGAEAEHERVARTKFAAERDSDPIVLDAATRETRFCVPIALDAAPATGTAAETDPTAPRWIQVAAEGAYAKNGQQFTLDRPVFEQIVRNIRARASFRKGPDGIGNADVVPFDWRHASEMAPTVPGAFGSQQALGWALDFDVREAGGKAQLWALSRFFPDVASAIARGAVKWTSIAVWPNATDPHGRPIGWDISSIALTNDPHIQGMVPIGATRFGRDETSAAPAAPSTPARNRETRNMDETLKALLIALGKHFNCAGTPEAVQHHLEHQAPLVLQRMTMLEKGAADEPGRLQFFRKVLADDGDADGANAKDFDDVMKRIKGRMSAARDACVKAESDKAQLAKDRDGIMAELESMYGGEVKDEEDRVSSQVKATMSRNGLDPEKDQTARIAFSGLCLERTGGVMPPDRKTYTDAGKWLTDTKQFLATRANSEKVFIEKYPAPEAAAAPVSPSSAPYLYQRYGQGGQAQPQQGGPIAFMRGGAAGPTAPIALGNGGRPLADGPVVEQGGLDFNRFLASAGRNATERAVSYLIGLDPNNAKLEKPALFNLARPIARQAQEIATAQGISL